MPPAARVGDLAAPAHAGALAAPGSPNILIDGLAAVRMSDPFTCALPPGAGPHFPNFAVTGSATVLSNFQPTVRVGDTTACGATILIGSALVFIGGPTHGDQSETVDGIVIRGSPAFIARVKADLARLRALPDGATLLDGMTNTTIVEYTGPNSYAIPLDRAGAYGGSGSGVVVGYNPNLTLQANTAGGGTAPTPSQLVVGHELIHGSHFNKGTTEPDDEAQTIGYGAHAGESPTENSLRAQTSPALGQRSDHGGVVGRTPGVPPGPVQ